MKAVTIIFCLTWTFLNAEISLQPASEPKQLSVSVIIPCASTHFCLIPELLTNYNCQTVLPDEIVISLSECEKVHLTDLEIVEHYPWKFELKIIKNREKFAAGKNRNIAFDHSRGDLIFLQDADDLPHPKRVEIIKYLFQNFEVEHLLHLWKPLGQTFEEYENKNLKAHYLKEYPSGDLIGFTNGHACLLRSICNKIKWPEDFGRTEDTDFNKMIYADSSIMHKVIVFADLIEYRQQFSTRAGDPIHYSADDITYESLMTSRWTDHVCVLRCLFALEKISSFLEFGTGKGSKFFLDNCDHVTSCEISTSFRNMTNWYQASVEAYKNYSNWTPIHLFTSEIFDFFNTDGATYHDPILVSSNKYVEYLAEVESICDMLSKKRNYDLVFIDPGIISRADFVNYWLGKVDVIVVHDSLAPIYGWARIKEHPDYEKIRFSFGEGVDIWIKRTRQSLIDGLKREKYLHFGELECD